jgi:hypothetical protein
MKVRILPNPPGRVVWLKRLTGVQPDVGVGLAVRRLISMMLLLVQLQTRSIREVVQRLGRRAVDPGMLVQSQPSLLSSAPLAQLAEQDLLTVLVQVRLLRGVFNSARFPGIILWNLLPFQRIMLMFLHQLLQDTSHVEPGVCPYWSPSFKDDVVYLEDSIDLVGHIRESIPCNADPVSDYILGGIDTGEIKVKDLGPHYSPLQTSGDIFIEACRPAHATDRVSTTDNDEYPLRFGWLVQFLPAEFLRAFPDLPDSKSALQSLRNVVINFDETMANPELFWISKWTMIGLVKLECGEAAVTGPLAHAALCANQAGETIRKLSFIVQVHRDDTNSRLADVGRGMTLTTLTIAALGLWLWHQQKDAVAAGKKLSIVPLRKMVQKRIAKK